MGNNETMSEETGLVERGVIYRMGRVLGMLSSAFLMFLIIKWTFDLVERDVSDLPVFNSLNIEVRKKPENPGGEVTQHGNLSINDLIGSESFERNDKIKSSINLAPIVEELSLLEKNTPMMIGDGTNNQDELAKTITNALKSILGEENTYEISEKYSLQLGSYSHESDAKINLDILLDKNVDLLKKLNSEIKITSLNEEIVYRLKLTGFSSLSEARQMCAALDARNEDCVVVAEETSK